ncbi:molybdenum ABC transporter ATP-binding protein [Kordiimonas aquimaris]|uniref:molybdenum ABC transporter ATP-binding protein n=1 Tax=Kordiimonas aquimaris TaxID=707591 RepID=UPI0021CE08C7|nr:molybdenum ABC transporter ATP-binding protein [Kordiimonas aquimaris]
MGNHSEIDVSLAGRIGAFELNCNFTVPANGVTALLGPSGCGKTTVLRCIAGLEGYPGRISVRGNIWQDSEASSHMPTHKRSVGYVFQEASLFPHLSVRDNLLFGTLFSRRKLTNEEEKSPSIPEVISLFGLKNLLERFPTALSGGERQRVAMGRALLAHPALLLMDEPLSGLDQQTKDDILPYLDRLHQTLKVPMLYVSHDMAEVARIADQVVMMANGRVVNQGPTAEVLERLNFNDIADHGNIGAIIEATINTHDKTMHMTELKFGSQSISVPYVNAATGTEVRVLVKSSDVSLATERPEHISIRNVLSGKLIALEVIEGTAFVDAVIDVDGEKIRAQITRSAANDLSLATGQAVYALVKSVTFDPRSLSASG